MGLRRQKKIQCEWIDLDRVGENQQNTKCQCVEMLVEIEGGSVKMEKEKSRNEGQIQKEVGGR